jgi:hypothetical protein
VELIDSALTGMAEFVRTLSDLDADGSTGPTASIERLRLSMPVELEVGEDPRGGLRISLAPPTQQVATSVMPVFHQLTIVGVPQDAQGRQD